MLKFISVGVQARVTDNLFTKMTEVSYWLSYNTHLTDNKIQRQYGHKGVFTFLLHINVLQHDDLMHFS